MLITGITRAMTAELERTENDGSVSQIFAFFFFARNSKFSSPWLVSFDRNIMVNVAQDGALQLEVCL